jgi:Flp pilus assembly pilin Flp
MSFIRRLRRDEAAATSIEYALILSLVAVVSVPSFETVGTNLALVMEKVAHAECQATEGVCVMNAPD